MSAAATCARSSLRLSCCLRQEVPRQESRSNATHAEEKHIHRCDASLSKHGQMVSMTSGLVRFQDRGAIIHHSSHATCCKASYSPCIRRRKRPRCSTVFMSVQAESLPCKWMRIDPDRDTLANSIHLVPDIELRALNPSYREDTIYDDTESVDPEQSQDVRANGECLSDATSPTSSYRYDDTNEDSTHSYKSGSHKHFQTSPSGLHSQTSFNTLAIQSRQQAPAPMRQGYDITTGHSGINPVDSVNLPSMHFLNDICDKTTILPSRSSSYNSYSPESNAVVSGKCVHHPEHYRDTQQQYHRHTRSLLVNELTGQAGFKDTSSSLSCSPSSESPSSNHNQNNRIAQFLSSTSTSMGTEKELPGKSIGHWNRKFPALPNEGLMMLEAVNGFLLYLHADRTILYVSENVSDHLGYNQAKMIGHPVDVFIHPSDLKELQRHTDVACLSQSGKNGCLLSQMTRRTFHLGMSFDPKKDSQRKNRLRSYTMVQWNVKFRFCQDDRGQVQIRQLICICCPVRTHAILEIREEGAMFMSRHDLGFHFTYCDARIIKLMGYEPSDLIGRSAYHFHCPKDVGLCKSCHMKLMVDGASSSGYYRFLSRAGVWVWLVTHATIIEDTQRRPQYIVCRNYVVSECEAEDAIAKEKREYEEMKCLGFSLDAIMPPSVNVQLATSYSSKSNPVSSIDSDNFNGASTSVTHLSKIQHENGTLSSPTETIAVASRHSVETLPSFTEHDANKMQRPRKCHKSSHRTITSSLKSAENLDPLQNGAQVELMTDQNEGSLFSDAIHSGYSSSIVDQQSSKKSESLEGYSSHIVAPNYKQFPSSEPVQKNSLLYLLSNPSLASSQTSELQILSQEPTATPMENVIDQTPCSKQDSLLKETLCNSNHMPNSVGGYDMSGFSKNVTILKGISGDKGVTLGVDRTAHFTGHTLEFEDPSLNQTKDDDQLMIPLLSNETSFSESTMEDTDMDLDSRSTFFSNNFNMDIFPELDLNSEFSFHTNYNSPRDERLENADQSHECKLNDISFAHPTHDEKSLQISSEPLKDIEMKNEITDSSYHSSPSIDPFQYVNNNESIDIQESPQTFSLSDDQPFIDSGHPDSTQSSSVVTPESVAEAIRIDLDSELMEVVPDVSSQEHITVTKSDSSKPLSVSPCKKAESPSSPLVAQIVPDNSPSRDFIDSFRGINNRNRSLLRSLLRKENKEVSDVSFPSVKSFYEDQQKSELRNKDFNFAQNMISSTELPVRLSSSEKMCQNNTINQKVTQELPLPKPAIGYNLHPCPSPSQTLILSGERGVSSEIESCASSQSGDHLPEDLVDLAMDYCSSMDNKCAQELISELSNLEWVEKLKNWCPCGQEENVKPSSQPLPIPGLSPNSQKTMSSSQQQPCPKVKRLNKPSASASEHKLCHVINDGKITRKSDSSSVSSGQGLRRSLLREAVTSPNVDKLIEQLPFGRVISEGKNGRKGPLQANQKTRSGQHASLSNIHSTRGLIPNSNCRHSMQKSSLNNSHGSATHVHSTDHSPVRSCLTKSFQSSSTSPSPKFPKIISPSMSPNSSLILHMSPSSARQKVSDNAGTSSSTKSSQASKNFTSSTEPVSVMVMRKEHHRSRRCKNATTQTENRPDEIYPDPEPSSTDIIITPSVYVAQHPSPLCPNMSQSSSFSPPQHEHNILPILVTKPSTTPSIESDAYSCSSSLSSPPVRTPEPDTLSRSQCTSTETPSLLSTSHCNQSKPVSNLPFLQRLLTGELNKHRYQLLDQQLLERERSGSGSSCSDFE